MVLQRPWRAFTLIELLVVISIIAILIGILLPALSMVRRTAQATKCLANMRSMQIAHWMYATAYNGSFINAGLAHSGAGGGEDASVAWINTLEEFYGSTLLARSPLDDSPYWEIPEPGSGNLRRTSYGVNNFVTDVVNNDRNPWGPPPPGFTSGTWRGGNGKPYTHVDRVQRPSATNQFLIMAYEGGFAAADHPHIETWLLSPDPRTLASQQVQINAVRGEEASWAAKSNWGFLDGHAEQREFQDMLTSIEENQFDPKVAR